MGQGRTPGVWRRSGQGGAWYSTVGGKKVRLADATASKREALEALARVLTRGVVAAAVPPGDLTVRDCVNLYLADRMEAARLGAIEKASYVGYMHYLGPFAKALGHLPAEALAAATAEAWVRSTSDASVMPSGRAWGDSTRAGVTSVIRACFRWCVRAGHLARSPVEGMRGPAPRVRTDLIDAEQAARLIEAAAPELGTLLQALLLTGCRPSEAATLTADRVDLAKGVWLVEDKIRRKTGRQYRTVYLSAAAVELTRKQMEKHPAGLLFRNSKGRPWTRPAWAHAIQKLRARLGFGRGCVAYAMRHLYCQSLGVAGVPIWTAAELMGHKDIKMIQNVYGQLGLRVEHLREAAAKAG